MVALQIFQFRFERQINNSFYISICIVITAHVPYSQTISNFDIFPVSKSDSIWTRNCHTKRITNSHQCTKMKITFIRQNGCATMVASPKKFLKGRNLTQNKEEHSYSERNRKWNIYALDQFLEEEEDYCHP